jgi:hypothetical protein
MGESLVPFWSVLLIGSMALAGLGCGSKSGPSNGTVTLDGKPLPWAFLSFHPEGGQGTATSAISDANGQFDVSGIVPGSYRVVVSIDPRMALGPPPDPADAEATKLYHEKSRKATEDFHNPLPADYGDRERTPLRLTMPVLEPVHIEIASEAAAKS